MQRAMQYLWCSTRTDYDARLKTASPSQFAAITDSMARRQRNQAALACRLVGASCNTSTDIFCAMTGHEPSVSCPLHVDGASQLMLLAAACFSYRAPHTRVHHLLAARRESSRTHRAPPCPHLLPCTAGLGHMLQF